MSTVVAVTGLEPTSFPPPPHGSATAAPTAASAATAPLESLPTDVVTDDTVDLQPGGGNVLPPSADAPFFGVPVNMICLVAVCACLAIGVFLPLIASDRTSADKYALFCFVPAVLFALFAGIRHRDEVHFRQLVVRFAAGFLLLTPFSWVAALVCIGVSVMLVSVVAAFVPLPGYIFAVIFVILAFGSITSMEMLFMWAVLTKHDNIRSLEGSPRQYPFFAASIALGMGTASTYYIILFLRALVDEANRHACDVWTKEGGGSSSSGGDHNNTATVHGHSSMVAALATTLAPAAPPSSSSAGSDTSSCHTEMSTSDLIVILVAAVCLIQPMIVLASYHLGLVAARLQLLEARISAVAEIAPSVLFRTFFLSAVIVGPGLIGPFVLLVLAGVVVAFFGFIKRYEHKMPRAYLDRVGYLNVFGYGALSQSDDGPSASSGQEMDTPASAANAV